MNENAKKWVEALKSGQFQQARGQLRRKLGRGDYAYCCLGLACELYRQDVGGRWREETVFGNAHNSAGLPAKVAKWLGANDDALVYLPRIGKDLAWLNDQGMTFKEIAALINRYKRSLFTTEESRD